MADQVRIVISSLDRFTAKVVKRLTLEAHANLVAAPSEGGTPVDTGWARANWVPTIGAPAADTVGTQEQAAAGNVNAGAAEAGLARVVTQYRLEQGPVFLTNNVPYIGFLNEGSSRQAPKGFVQLAIAKAVRTVNRQLRSAS